MIIKLKEFDINAIKTLLERSLMVSNNLDFEISSDFIKSSVSNDDQNFWKEWCIPTTGLFTSEKFDFVKVLFSNGSYFKAKFLGLFSSQKCEVNITVNDKNEAESFEVIGKTSFGSKLRVNMRCTRYEMAKDKLEEKLHDTLFSDDNAIAWFKLEPNIVSEISKLRSLNSMSDAPQAFVTFKGGDGSLKAFDSSFEFEISTYDGPAFEAKFPKKSLSLIDNEVHEVAYCKNSEFEFDWFMFKGNNAIVKSQSIAMLMTTLAGAGDDGINDDLFSDDSGWGME